MITSISVLHLFGSGFDEQFFFNYEQICFISCSIFFISLYFFLFFIQSSHCLYFCSIIWFVPLVILISSFQIPFLLFLLFSTNAFSLLISCEFRYFYEFFESSAKPSIIAFYLRLSPLSSCNISP